MKQKYTIGVLGALFLIAGLIAPVSAYSLLFFNPSVVESNPGEQPAIDLILEGCNAGISGYALYLILDNPTVASFGEITFPSWVTINKVEHINSSTVLIQGADLGNHVEPGLSTSNLAKISIHALTAGYATLSAEPVIVDDDKKGRYYPISKTASIVISGAGPNPMIPASR